MINLKHLFISLLVFGTIFSVKAKNFVVVLDPGHGGSDPGVVRQNIYESNINLAIALFVGEMLENHSDIEVAYTRKTDKKLEPETRMSYANDANGDIFVSIHVNSAYSEKLKKDIITISGVEVYIIEQNNKERSETVLKKKSAIISINENNEDIEHKFDPSSSHSNFSFKLKQQNIFNQSNYLALYIQREMGDENRNTRGIMQKSLYVTWQTKMPSVLVEVGYITNLSEREFLTSTAGQKSLARGIYNGIMAYKKDYVSRETALQPAESEVESKSDAPPKNVAKTDENQIVFKWQIMTSKTPLEKNDARFKNLKNCGYYIQDNIYKYTYGESSDYKEVEKMKTTVKKLFPDAFIIATKNGKRVDYKR
jgi:N-acetylmuramoyl-L-alanine amidase